MTQAQMAHAQWEASRAAPVQVSSYTAGYRPHQAATAESYDFGHALQRPAVQQQQPGYAAPYQLRRSVSLDPSRTPPPPRLNPGSPAFAPRSPPAVGGRARARHHPNSPGTSDPPSLVDYHSVTRAGGTADNKRHRERIKSIRTDLQQYGWKSVGRLLL